MSIKAHGSVYFIQWHWIVFNSTEIKCSIWGRRRAVKGEYSTETVLLTDFSQYQVGLSPQSLTCLKWWRGQIVYYTIIISPQTIQFRTLRIVPTSSKWYSPLSFHHTKVYRYQSKWQAVRILSARHWWWQPLLLTVPDTEDFAIFDTRYGIFYG